MLDLEFREQAALPWFYRAEEPGHESAVQQSTQPKQVECAGSFGKDHEKVIGCPSTGEVRRRQNKVAGSAHQDFGLLEPMGLARIGVPSLGLSGRQRAQSKVAPLPRKRVGPDLAAAEIHLLASFVLIV